MLFILIECYVTMVLLHFIFGFPNGMDDATQVPCDSEQQRIMWQRYWSDEANKWKNEWTNEWTNVWTNERENEQMNEWKKGWMKVISSRIPIIISLSHTSVLFIL